MQRDRGDCPGICTRTLRALAGIQGSIQNGRAPGESDVSWCPSLTPPQGGNCAFSHSAMEQMCWHGGRRDSFGALKLEHPSATIHRSCRVSRTLAQKTQRFAGWGDLLSQAFEKLSRICNAPSNFPDARTGPCRMLSLMLQVLDITW